MMVIFALREDPCFQLKRQHLGKRHTKLEREQVKKKQVVERTQQFSQQHLVERKQQQEVGRTKQQVVERTKQCPQQLREVMVNGHAREITKSQRISIFFTPSLSQRQSIWFHLP